MSELATTLEVDARYEQVDTQRGIIQEARQGRQTIPRKAPVRCELLTLNEAVLKQLSPRLHNFASECALQLKSRWNSRARREEMPLKRAPHPTDPGRHFNYATLPYDVAMDLMEQWIRRSLRGVKARLEQDRLAIDEAIRMINEDLERLGVSDEIHDTSDEEGDGTDEEEIAFDDDERTMDEIKKSLKDRDLD
jgi:hypothetical protein